ncbi:MAG: hypothetical protein ACXWTY_08785 [Methylobacter sp.]
MARPGVFSSAKASKNPIVALGIRFLMAFLILRLNNIYGDPRPWLPQKNLLFTIFAVLNCEKYPPSLLYLLMTLGPALLGLVLFEWNKLHRFCRPLITLGRVPLFFYLIHLALIHGAALALTQFRGLPIDWLFRGSGRLPFPTMPASEYGYDLTTVYGVWLVLLILLHPLCYAYA